MRASPRLPLRPTPSAAGVALSTSGSARVYARRNARVFVTRHASTSSKAAGPVTAQHRALTLVHKTRAVLPRILPVDNAKGDTTGTLAFWDALLSSTQDSISSSRGPDARARLVIYACDAYAGPDDLLVSLLEDPFGTSPESTRALRSRWDAAQTASSVTISTDDASTVRVTSAFLQQLPSPTQLVELRPGAANALSTRTLLTADLPVVLWNPASTPLSVLERTFRPLSRFLLVVAAANAPGLEGRVKQRVMSLLPPQKTPADVEVIFVDPARALSAVNTLRQNPSSLSAVQRFQDDFLGSGVSRLHKVIEEDLKNAGISESSQSTLPDLRLRTTLGALRSALNECRSSVRDAREDMDVAYAAIDELKDELSAVHARAHAEVLGDMDSATSGKTPAAQVNDPVGSALANAERGVRATLDRLTWWKLLYKVDDVDFIVNSAIAKVWFKDLEPQLIMQTGRLAALQGRLAASTNALVSSLPRASAFYSPVLSNTLAQLVSTPSFAVTAASLTSPLRARQAQLAHPATRLHRAAQRTVSGLGAGVLGSTSVGAAGWMGYLSTGPLASFGVMEGPTALGIAAVGVLASARWAVGRWERAKGRWWEDWERVGAGVRRDLSNNLDAVVRNQVTLIPARACEELEAMAIKRRADIDDVKHELDMLESELATVQSGRAQ